jgi:hypothetical protein
LKKAVVAIGTFAAYHGACRDYLLQHDIMKPIVNMFTGVFYNVKSPNLSFLRKGTWCISVLCGTTHKVPPPWKSVKDALPLMGELLFYFDKYYDDEQVLVNVCDSLAFLLPGITEQKITLRFLDLLK